MKRQLVSYQMENSENVRALDRRYYLNCRFEQNVHSNPELIYVIEGALDVTIDGNTMTIPEGRFCLVLPWQIHSFDTRERSRSVILVFSQQYVQPFARSMLSMCGDVQVFQADPDVRSLFLRYLCEGPLPDEAMISCVLLGLCHCFASNCNLKQRAGAGTRSGLFDAMYYISTHCAERLTLRDVADALGYSYYHLSHIFKECVGMSFTRFCNMLRVDRAVSRLRDSGDSVTDIAFECGFSSVRNFNRAFAEFMEMTPREYRVRHSEQEERASVIIESGMINGPAM